MHLSDDDFDELDRAYRFLAVSHDSSVLQIKRAYRRLAKSWHPDKTPLGSLESQRAGERMREINEAFQLVKHAPLRFAITKQSAPGTERWRESHTVVAVTDRIEYAIRLAAGFIVGALASFVWVLSDLPLAAAVILPLFTATASAIYGDRFWRWLLRFWWLW